MLSSKDFVRDQFNNFNKHAAYRDVLMLTSFVETIVRDTSAHIKNFGPALEALGLDIDEKSGTSAYSESCDYKDCCLVEANRLRLLRNKLLHDVLKENMAQEYVHQIIEEMRTNIVKIYDESNLIREFFIDKYGFDTKGILLRKWVKD